ncbi:MAG: arginine--tRNA ligase, partial [Anaerolineales bacterium]
IYVIDVRQSLHMQQVFKILELWGFPQAEKCFHLGYGFVSLPEGTMSARKGRLVLFKDVADEAERRVLSVIAEKNPGLSPEERQQVAHQIGLGALIYTMLSVDNNRDIVFDMDAALNFDGRTAPYIQNAHVRANSILRKANGIPSEASFDYQLSPHEITMIDLISRFPETVQTAAQEYRPITIANYVYDLATAFHSFYHVIQVIQTEDESIRAARLRLVAAARQTLANGLALIGIEAPNVM